jgi:hypothetical protein
MTPKGGHVQQAHAEPRIGRSHEFHHFAGGLPAATFVGERTFRWRGVGSDTRDYFHVPLPRRERVAALLTLGSGTVQCNRAGIRRPHGSILSPPCKRRSGADFDLHRFHFRYTARATSVAGWPWPPLLCPRKLAALIERSAASLLFMGSSASFQHRALPWR